MNIAFPTIVSHGIFNVCGIITISRLVLFRPRLLPVTAFTTSPFVRRSNTGSSSILDISSNRLTNLGVSFSPSDSSPNSGDEYELAKWEKMYGDGKYLKQGLKGDLSKMVESQTDVNMDGHGNCGVRVVTFDLDNTLWKTSPVISEANDVLATYLKSHLPLNHKRVEIVMNELFKENRKKYAPNNPEASYATHLTHLRKDAIRKLFLLYNEGKNENDANLFAEEAFQVWTEARHTAIPFHFAQSVIPSLEKIRSMKTLDGHPIIVGAITDGNSDPRNVPILKPFFDFCINSETVGVSKPNKEVYLAAISKFSSQPAVQSILSKHLNYGIKNKSNELDYDYILDNQILGPWWIHIGDDFMKDIVASNELSIRSIWCRELVKEKLGMTQNKSQSEETSKQRDVSDLMRDITNKGGYLTMTIGADDFLTDSIHTEFADAIVDEFKHVATILRKWNKKPITTDQDKTHQSFDADSEKEQLQFKSSKLLSKFSTEDIQGTSIESEVAKDANGRTIQKGKDNASKFCIECGTKLPSVAKFCTSCGTKQ